MEYKCPHCLGTARAIPGISLAQCEGEKHCRFMAHTDEFDHLGTEASSAEFNCSVTKPSEEVEMLRQTIRTALCWLQEYKSDGDNATHAKRILFNAKYEFDGK